MSEIPKDIELKARTIASIFDQAERVRLIGQMILAERERCAVVAEAKDRAGRDWVPDSIWAQIKRETAAAIRRGTP